MALLDWLAGIKPESEDEKKYWEEKRARDYERRQRILDPNAGLYELNKELSGYTDLDVKTATVALCKEIIRLRARIEILENQSGQ